METLDYTPNTNDPRIRRKLKSALGMTLGCLGKDKPRELGSRFIDRYYGQGQTPISRWLRQTLLVEHDGTWNKDTGRCKTYTYNAKGVEHLKQTLDYKITHYNRTPKQLDELELKRVALDWSKQNFDLDNIEYNDKSHRLWHPLQNLPTKTRNIILRENGMMVQYDIRAAAPTLLYQHYINTSQGVVLDTVDDYTQRIDAVRAGISADLEIPLPNTKQLLTLLFSGGYISSNPYTSAYQLLLGDRARISAAKQHPYIRSLISDIKQLWAELKPTMTSFKRVLSNGVVRTETLTPKNKWHTYFLLERQVLDEMRDYLQLVGTKHFLLHDAVISTALPYGIEDLQRWVLAGTGYDLEFSESII